MALTKDQIIEVSVNFVDYWHPNKPIEDRFMETIRECRRSHPDLFPSLPGQDDNLLSIDKTDLAHIAVIFVRDCHLSDHLDRTRRVIDTLSKFYPQYGPISLPSGQEYNTDKETEELFIPEDEENPSTPVGIDPDSVIQLEEVKEPSAVNMEGEQHIPIFRPISIPLDDTPQQPVIDPSNPALAYFRGMPYTIPPVQQTPIHKVDNPAQVPVAPPVNTDPVEVNLGLISMNGMVQAPVQTQKPEFINPNLPKPALEQNKSAGEVKNSIDNSAMIKKFPKLSLGHIEHLANINGCSVFFEEYPAEGIVSVTTLDSDDKVIPWKSFCIDSGKIIDPRVKLIAGNPKFDVNSIIEKLPLYELNSGRNGTKVLDTRMLEDIFKAGLENISKKRMYQKAWQDLNLKVALITLPTSFLNKEERKSLQDYIMKMDKDGYFDKAISMSPGCRFVFFTKRLDKEHIGRFTLINEGVPMYYGGPVPENLVPIIIESNDGKIDIRTNGNADPNALPAIRYEQ